MLGAGDGKEHAVPSESATAAPQRDSTAEATRLAAVARLHILGTESDAALDRVVALAARLLDAPIATVSIVDADRIWCAASHGPAGVERLPGALGWCASAIRQAQPYVVTDAATDPRTAGNPLVQGQWKVRCYAAAPITTADGHRLGTINVLDTRARELSDMDLAALRDLAAVVMDELELRLATVAAGRRERQLREHVAEYSATLQRTLLPPLMPTVDGLQLASRYHAAAAGAVTGDFYDVFALGNGRWAFLVGDVAGHGAAAAAVTSLTRYTLRTAALHAADPAAALAELNTVLLMDPHARQTCTVLFGIMAPHSAGGFDITLAGGGHPPALWLRPGDETTEVEPVWPAGGMLVGALPQATFATSQLHLRPGHSLLLYTDGLIEARSGNSFDEQRLRDFLAERAPTRASDLIEELSELISGLASAPSDDIALLALRVPTTTQAHAGTAGDGELEHGLPAVTTPGE